MAREIPIFETAFKKLEHSSERSGKSLSEKLDELIHIGSIFDNAHGFDYEKFKQAATGQIPPEELSSLEGALWLQHFQNAMGKPGPNEESFFKERRDAER